MEVLLALALAFLGIANTPKKEAKKENLQEQVKEVYNPSETRLNDIIHTSLELSFDWQNQYVLGSANMKVKPYFYPSSQLILDAKGFDIHSVEVNQKQAKYSYDNLFLTIELDKEYTREETYSVSVKYTAKPNELNVKGSQAISEAKGLYFINPLNTEDKPQQIWTQGETEASSCWFPTIDSPNERMTQDIAVTVQNRFKTLSNGLLIKSVDNNNGTRTDYWSQKLAHTPYLAMLAIGEFLVTTDKWKELDVEYFLEKDYHPYARGIFGKTPDMLEHFSFILGVDYPWEKYAQVVVRDFVSGAMENTTAVIHGEFVQMTDRELLDDHQEDIIAHELIHHWFGDLVTCESWANLPLNESFATYFEYVWREESFGRMGADQHLDADLNSYLNESKRKQVDMIRFNYSDKEDMFDSHSYAKGGRILHMLRHYLGDDAFFKGLKLYLNQNAFQTVEIHQLRLAMEEVCGQDLNWFFNQWFLSSGHPLLVVDYVVGNNTVTIKLDQIQDQTTTPVYRLPMVIDVYQDGVPTRYQIDMQNKTQSFEFEFEGKLTNVIVDAEQMLLAEIFDNKPKRWWLNQLDAPLYMDQKRALNNIDEEFLKQAIAKAITHDYWGIRNIAIDRAAKNKIVDQETIELIFQIALNDSKTKVQAKAIDYLAKLPNKQDYLSLFEQNTKHLSYAISGASLNALSLIDPAKSLELADSLVSTAKNEQAKSIKKVYAEHGGPDKMEYFVNLLETESNYALFTTTGLYVDFLKNQEVGTTIKGIDALEKLSLEATSWMVWVSERLLQEMKEHFEQELKIQKDKEVKAQIEAQIKRIDGLLGL
jgi:aminopeptidase N